MPGDIASVTRRGGGVREWLWKGTSGTPVAEINTVLAVSPDALLTHRLSFTEKGHRFEILKERVGSVIRVGSEGPYTEPLYWYYQYSAERPILKSKTPLSPLEDPTDDAEPDQAGRWTRTLRREDINPELSIIAQRNDPDSYPEIASLSRELPKIFLFRNWEFGPDASYRAPQPPDLPNARLNAKVTNLAHVFNRLCKIHGVKRRIIEALHVLYEGIDDVDVDLESGSVQLIFHEGRSTIPSTRLSDGTLRYFCLLAILCDPNPPPLICIEEPELGYAS